MVVLTRKLHADLAHDKLSCVNTNCLVLEMESDWESYRGCLYSLSYAHILGKKKKKNYKIPLCAALESVLLRRIQREILYWNKMSIFICLLT